MTELLEIYQAMLGSFPSFFGALFSVEMIVALLVGVIGGLIIGALPGLNATTGIVLLLSLIHIFPAFLSTPFSVD